MGILWMEDYLSSFLKRSGPLGPLGSTRRLSRGYLEKLQGFKAFRGVHPPYQAST